MVSRETPKALQAFNDYLAMGESRSLEKLLAQYESATKAPPTKRLDTLKEWSGTHHWQDRIAELKRTEQAAIIARGIAERQNRVDAINDRWHRMKEVIRARGEDMADEVAGGDTGLLVRTYKAIGTGPNARTVEEYAVDTGLLKSMLDHEKQAAQELGQWTEKQDVTSDGKAIPIVYVNDWRKADEGGD